jgi:concentrative nucleoside transporter, CNT family
MNEKDDIPKEKYVATTGSDSEVEADRDDPRPHDLYARFRPYILTGVALVILGWWISATILKATRHRWYVVIPAFFMRWH